MSAAKVTEARAREIQETAAGILSQSMRGAVVLGREGLGKSSLAEQVVARLGMMVDPVWVYGSPLLAQVPYGVLAPFLDAADAGDMESPLAVLRAVRRSFSSRGEAGHPPALLVVDDAHHLDEGSAHVLSQLALSGEIRLLVLARSAAAQVQELIGLSRDGILARVDLAPLEPEAVHGICEELLGGPLLRASGRVIASLTAGNPLYVKVLVEHLRGTGHLHQSNGAWFLAGLPDSYGSALEDLVKGVLAEHTPAQRAVLEASALAGPVPRALLAAATDPAALQVLLQERLLAADQDAAETTALAIPLQAEVLRTLVPPARSARMHAVFTARAEYPADEGQQVRAALWALECGAGADDAVLVPAARAANRLGASASAIKLAAAATGADHLFAARVEIAAAYVETGTFAQARVLLDGLLDSRPAGAEAGLDTATLNRAVTVLARLLHRTGRPAEEMLRLAAAWRTRMDEAMAPHGERSSDAMLGLGPALLEARAAMVEGRYADVARQLQDLVEEAGTDRVSGLLGRALLAEALSALGRLEEAAVHSSAAVRLLATGEPALTEHCAFVLFRHAAILLHLGSYDELEELAEQCLQVGGARLVGSGGTLGVFQGLVELHQGRLREGVQRLHPAVEALRRSDPELLLPFALGAAGYASAVVGEAMTTARYATEVAAVRPAGPLPLHLVARAYAAAAVAASEGSDAEIPPELTAAADQAGAAGLRTAEKDILELCLAVGDLSRARRLAELAADYPGGAARALQVYAEAVASGNPERMVAAADDAVRYRKYLIAVESIGHAIRFYGNHGNLRRQRALIQQLRRRREELAGVTVSYLSPSLHLVRLTRREHEIVQLLLEGAGSRDIAAHFTLSQRTVEGHIYRIYVKLGISRRADLETAYRALEPGPRTPALP